MMSRLKLFFATISIAVSLVFSGAANAAQYLVTYEIAPSAGGSIARFSGTLTTTDTANGSGFFLITGLTGTRNGIAAMLAPTGSLGGNDNLFKPGADFVDVNGFAYVAGGTQFNVFRAGPSALQEFRIGNISNFKVSAISSAVPESATWLMMIVGFGLVGAGMRRRIQISNSRFEKKMKRAYAEIQRSEQGGH